MKKQPAWGYRVARPFREVNRRVTYALGLLEAKGHGEFPERRKTLTIIPKLTGISLNLAIGRKRAEEYYLTRLRLWIR